jgi:hypothetical protein
VFDKAHFECNGDIYDAIKPALRLATLFITEENMLGWWVSLIQG